MRTSSAMQYLPHLERSGIDALLGEWKEAYPGMGVLALLPEGEQAAVATLQAGCTARHVPLVGGLFPALTDEQGFVENGAWLLRFDRMPHAALYPDLPQEEDALHAALDGMVSDLGAQLGSHPDDATLFMLFDAMVPNIGTILDELYLRLANRVHYVGVNAGSETFQPMPCLFDGERLVQGGVAVMLLKPHRGAILAHGYQMPDQVITATSTEGNHILQIDWRPAFEVYREMALAHYGVQVSRDNFYQLAVHFPFGIVHADGIIVVRIPVALEADGSLFCVGEVPPNALLTLLRAPEVDSRQTLETLAKGMSDIGAEPQGRELLLFYCAGRRLHLGIDAAAEEVRSLARRTGAAQLAGALSLGEIGTTARWGYPLFHNATLVTTLWQE